MLTSTAASPVAPFASCSLVTEVCSCLGPQGVMPRGRNFHSSSFTLATASLSSTGQINQYAHPLPPSSQFEDSSPPKTAPVQLHSFQPELPKSQSTLKFTPRPKNNPLDWLFGFLRDGTSAVHGFSDALGVPKKASLFRQRKATGGLLSRPLARNEQRNLEVPPEDKASASGHTVPSKSNSSANHGFPAWSTWKDWKKISLDFYIRLLDTPQNSRLRLKQTIAPLPILKFKPVIDLAYRGQSKSPLTMHLDVKMLDCIKYRVHTDGSSHLQVRAKAPLADPRFTMDVIYERQLGTSLDSVKISFRALGVAFLKAPSPGFGCKIPIRFNNGVKTTIRVKKFIDQREPVTSGNGPKYARRGHRVTPKSRTPNRNRNAVSRSGSAGNGWHIGWSKIGIFGPIGVDIKLRCLEYR